MSFMEITSGMKYRLSAEVFYIVHHQNHPPVWDDGKVDQGLCSEHPSHRQSLLFLVGIRNSSMTQSKMNLQ